MSDSKRPIPWILRPFVALWELIAWIITITGRLVAAILGGVLMLAGIIATLTIVGAVIGIPLFILGLLLCIRALV